MRRIDTIYIHCSATPNGKSVKPETINDWHRTRGFKRNALEVRRYNPHLPNIGYHRIINIDGSCYTGRSLPEVGSHVAGHNATSIGICMVGGLEAVCQYTQEAWNSLRVEVERLRKDIPTIKFVKGHRDASPDIDGDGVIEKFEWLKTCPGFDVAAWLANGMKPLKENQL